MSVSPKELLTLAEAVLNSATTEAEWRNAIGRAYYAIYHAGQAFHASLPSPGNLPPKPTGLHEELAYRLCWPTIPTDHAFYDKSRDLGRRLRWLCQKRVQADYSLNATIGEVEAIEVLERAKEAIALIK